jgi:hypothetical protein
MVEFFYSAAAAAAAAAAAECKRRNITQATSGVCGRQ